MKTLLIIVVFFIVVFFVIKKNLQRPINGKAPIDFAKVKSSNSSDKYLPSISKKWLIEAHEKYLHSAFNQFDNEYTQLINKVCNDVYSESEYWKKNKTHTEFFNELTEEQRILFSLIIFEGQVNNGGVYQFLFNYNELSIITLEALIEVNLDNLAKDYEKVLKEYFGKFATIQDLYNKFQNKNDNWDKRWNAFADGYKELNSSKIIESYFYSENFVKIFQDKLLIYIKNNSRSLYRELM